MSINAAHLLRSETCRAARALLGWTQARLSRETGVSLSAIKVYELGQSAPTLDTLVALADAFTKAGIEFVNGDVPGVLLHKARATASNGDGDADAAPPTRPGRRRGSSSAE